MSKNHSHNLAVVTGFVLVAVPVTVAAIVAYQYGKLDGRLEAWQTIKVDLQEQLDNLVNPQ